MLAWGNLENHQSAWELAKEKMHVGDVRELTSAQFHDLIALATQIEKGTVNVEAL